MEYKQLKKTQDMFEVEKEKVIYLLHMNICLK
jgi:hypothetical protein